MGCAGCSVSDGSTPKGCQSNGHCASGGCNKMNTYDWLSVQDIDDPSDNRIAEVSFKHGSKKGFFNTPHYLDATTGDWVVVDTGNGYDVGRVTLMGPLVLIQMKKKKANPERINQSIQRIASARDLDRMQEARSREQASLVKSRAIARTLDLNMKIGDVEYQADLKKATFYYTAEGRIDFRELVRTYAKEFRVKIEMRQIGARQESARIGGLGPCGRELCCSTWLSDFKSVSTVAARYQNLAINQAKLSGQCGRLKCCLNYELETYLEALEGFPKNVDIIKTRTGQAHLAKLDIFKGLMYYSIKTETQRHRIITLETSTVFEIKEMNARGEFPDDLVALQLKEDIQVDDLEFADVTGEIELPAQKRRPKRRNNRNRKRNQNRSKGRGPRNNSPKNDRPKNK